ncbi:MAG: hypothetical protein RIB60_05255 [Phycisphaerales bacterium]
MGTLPRAERAAALRHAIPAAAPTEVPAFVLALLDAANAPTPPAATGIRVWDHARRALASPAVRTADDALAALACVWKRVPSDLKGAALAVGRGRWTRAIDRAAASSDPFERESAAILIRDSSNATSAREACQLLTDDDRDVSRAADRALLSLTIRVAGIDHARLGPDLVFVPVSVLTDAAPRDVVVEHVAEAAWSFGDAHRGRDVLVAALLLADLKTPPAALTAPQRRLVALLTTPGHPAVGALRTLVRTTRSPELRARSLRWVAGGPLADAALERLSKSDSDDDHEAMLENAHLVLRPARAAAFGVATVRLAKSATGIARGGLLPDANAWARLAPNARRGYALLPGLLGLPRPARRAALAPCLGDPDPIARHRAARSCDPMDLADFTFDADARIARSAALRWSCAGLPDTMRPPRHAGDDRRARVVTKLARSPHRAVRSVAAADARRADPWDPESPGSRVVARRWLAEDNASFIVAARERLGDDDVAACVRTIRLLIAVSAAALFEQELAALLGDGARPRVAATAARALSAIPTAPARNALAGALRATDARVRANALEALVRSSRGRLGALVELKSDSHHRVRGAAVRAELDAATPGGLDDVLEMLNDARSEHRLAGVWVAERALTGRRSGPPAPGADAVLDRLSAIARSDASQDVRSRALRCVRRVLIETTPAREPDAPAAASQIEPAAPAALEVSA